MNEDEKTEQIERLEGEIIELEEELEGKDEKIEELELEKTELIDSMMEIQDITKKYY